MAKPYGENKQEQIVFTEVGNLITEIEKPNSQVRKAVAPTVGRIGEV